MKLFRKNQCTAEDFAENMLPQSRREIFFDVLKLHWKNLLLLGLVFLLFCLPYSIVSFFEQITLSSLLEYELTDEQVAYLRFNQLFIWEVIKAICTVIIFFGLSGIVRAIRQYAWEETALFSYDFLQGIKSNSKYMLFVGFIAGIAGVISFFASCQIPFLDNGVQAAMMYVPTLIYILVVIPLTVYQIVIISIYDVRFGDVVKISLMVWAKRPIKTYLAILCCLPLMIFSLVPNTVCNLIGYFAVPILFPTVFLGLYLFALNGLDDAVNREYYPSLVGKGLFTFDGNEI